MSEVPKIVDFESIVEPHLDGGKVVSYSSRYLTKPGDNYGSVMLAVVAHVRRSADGGIEELPLVAKLPPLTNEIYWNIFQPEISCHTENAIYKYVGPALRRLQLDAGIAESQLFDGFPRYYGSRISLDPTSTKVDRDAVLLQENMQTAGFKAGNRQKMYDYTHTVLLMKELARFHALPIALRLQRPEEFDKFVRPYFGRFNVNQNLPREMVDGIYGESLKEVELATNNNTDTLAKVKKLFDNYEEYMAGSTPEDTKYTTIAHSDLWINNLMLQYDENGLPARVKFVDFQTSQYDSLAFDLFFLLMTSVESSLVEQRYEEFVRIYFEAFVATLQSVHVSSEEYTLEGLFEEIARIAPLQIAHCIFMIKIILADNSTLPEDFKDLDMNIMSNNTGVPAITKKTADLLRFCEKMKYI